MCDPVPSYINTITTDVHNPVVPVFLPDNATNHMNSTQLMSECWSLGITYDEYKATAEVCGKYVYNIDEYKSHCESMNEQAAEYFTDSF